MRRFSIIIFILLLANYIYGQNAYKKPLSFLPGQNFLTLQKTLLPVTRHQLIVVAHRGSHLEVPENTLAAYENAIKEGADYVEVDLRTTKDGELVIMHDASVTKMTGEKGLIKVLNYNKIRNLKIKFRTDGDTTIYRVPDIASVLKLRNGRINIYLDFKYADVEKTYRLMKHAGMQKNVVVYLNKKEQYRQWKKIASHVPLMGSLPENMSISQLNDFLDKMSLRVVDNAYNNDKLRLMHKRKIAVWLDVQSTDEGPAKWEQALKKEVNGLQTDHPEKLIKYLEDREIR